MHLPDERTSWMVLISSTIRCGVIQITVTLWFTSNTSLHIVGKSPTSETLNPSKRIIGIIKIFGTKLDLPDIYRISNAWTIIILIYQPYLNKYSRKIHHKIVEANCREGRIAIPNSSFPCSCDLCENSIADRRKFCFEWLIKAEVQNTIIEHSILYLFSKLIIVAGIRRLCLLKSSFIHMVIPSFCPS